MLLLVEKAQQRWQLLAPRKPSSCWLSCRSWIIIYCAQRWIYSSPPSLFFSPRLEEPDAFHLGATTQGLCHLSCSPSGIFDKYFMSSSGQRSSTKHKTEACVPQGYTAGIWLGSDFLSQFAVQPLQNWEKLMCLLFLGFPLCPPSFHSHPSILSKLLKTTSGKESGVWFPSSQRFLLPMKRRELSIGVRRIWLYILWWDLGNWYNVPETLFLHVLLLCFLDVKKWDCEWSKCFVIWKVFWWFISLFLGL